jgi:hypothetical protein
MISIKDYAAQNNVSYEAVRQQVNRYAKELEGHITKVSRTKYLDDEAVAFLDERRKTNPVVVIERSKDEEREQLENTRTALLMKLAEVQDKLLEEKDKTAALLAENNTLRIELLEKPKNEEEVRAAVEAAELEKQKEIDALKAELELERSKSWWDKLRGK